MANNFVPNAPLTSFTEAQFLITANTNLSFLNDKPSGNSSGAPKPSIKSLSKIKSTLLNPALTSHFECYFNPPDDVRKYLAENRKFNYNSNTELITLSCSEASLPGSSLLTNEVNDDYTGVTERFAYRRQYDDRADFTFYVDHGKQDGEYNIIWFFENWIQYIANEQYSQGIEDHTFNYRFRFPDGKGDSGQGYRASALYINKFERDMKGSYLSYRFLKAYPIAINSMPISYESSELLKCTVSFTYTRYLVDRLSNQPNQPNQQPFDQNSVNPRTLGSEVRRIDGTASI
jgi:hypothetical protein